MHDLTGNGIYPNDVYTHTHYYNQGQDGESDVWWRVKSLRGKPRVPVTIYRAVPCLKRGVPPISDGDWVTPSYRYAREHGKHETDSSKDMCVAMTRVRAKCLHTQGDSIMEWGYNAVNGDCPKIKSTAVKFRPRKKRTQ